MIIRYMRMLSCICAAGTTANMTLLGHRDATKMPAETDKSFQKGSDDCVACRFTYLASCFSLYS